VWDQSKPRLLIQRHLPSWEDGAELDWQASLLGWGSAVWNKPIKEQQLKHIILVTSMEEMPPV
jgi:hypothetical protein